MTYYYILGIIWLVLLATFLTDLWYVFRFAKVKYILSFAIVAILLAFTALVSAAPADARPGHSYRGGHHIGKHYGGHRRFRAPRHYGGRHYRPHKRRYRPQAAPRYRPYRRHYRRRYYAPYYLPYVGIPFYSGDYQPYRGGCAWIKDRAAKTGSQRWWRDYYDCMDYYGH